MWVIFPILAAGAYAASAFLQNYLVDVAFPKRKVGAYLVTQLLSFGAGMLILYAMFGRGVFLLPMNEAIGLVVAGVVNVVGTAFSLKALRSGDTIEVTIFGESAPLVALAFGVIFLGETVTAMQGLGFALIMGAALLLIFERKSKKTGELNLRTAGLAFASVILWVMSDIIFVHFAGNNVNDFQRFGQGFFYFEMGGFLAAMLAVILVPSWRKTLREVFFKGRNRAKNVVAAVVENGFFTAGEFLFKLGLMAAPAVALMTVVSHVTQLGIVFVLGIFLARFFPRFAREKMTRRVVMQHLAAAVLVVTGMILLG